MLYIYYKYRTTPMFLVKITHRKLPQLIYAVYFLKTNSEIKKNQKRYTNNRLQVKS